MNPFNNLHPKLTASDKISQKKLLRLLKIQEFLPIKIQHLNQKIILVMVLKLLMKNVMIYHVT